MSSAGVRFVVDASAGIQLFLPEEHSDRVQALFDLLAADPPARLFVPDLFYAEGANILWKRVRRSELPQEGARGDVASLRALALRSVPTAELVETALDIAVRTAITAYDACYVALSERLGAPLVTADRRLIRRLRGHPYDLRWIGSLVLPGVTETPEG